VFALCAVVSGLLAKAGMATPLVFLSICALGAMVGALNGWLVAYLGLPSIVVTLAMMIASAMRCAGRPRARGCTICLRGSSGWVCRRARIRLPRGSHCS
jgi:predicted ABC-type sugar transport system permease subunit